MRHLRRALGFLLAVLILFGLLLTLTIYIRAHWYAYVVLGIAVLALLAVRLTPLWRGWRIPVCWFLALLIATGGMFFGRPDLSVSLRGTVFREVVRRVVKLDIDSAIETASGYLHGWAPPGDIAHKKTALPNATLEWLTQDDAPGKAIYYLHGGAYLMGLIDVYRWLGVNLIHRCGDLDVALLDYRIAPAHTFPAALDDALDGWQALLDRGYKPEDIMVCGDSAGGNLALALCLALRERGQALPCGILTVSAWADLADSGASHIENLYRDPMFGIPPGEVKTQPAVDPSYAGDTPFTNPLLSPVYATYEGFPPALLIVGDWEVMRSDSETIHAKLLAAGSESTLLIGPGMFHVYPMMLDFAPEGQAAWRAIEDFIAAHLTGRTL